MPEDRTQRRQLNMLLTPEAGDLLDAVAFLFDASPTDVARMALNEFLTRYEDDFTVKSVVAARQEHRKRRAKEVGDIADLPAARERRSP